VALGLLFIQGLSAIGGYYAQSQLAQAEAAFVLRERVASTAERLEERGQSWDAALRPSGKRSNGRIAFMITPRALVLQGYSQDPQLSVAARQLLQTTGEGLENIAVSTGPVSALPKQLSDPPMQSRFVRRLRNRGVGDPTKAILLTAQASDGRWVSSASFVRPASKSALISLLIKTLIIFAAVMIPLALVARRIVRPLERLKERVGRVGLVDEIAPLTSEGPSDIRDLIDSFNNMQARVSALLSEKDVMLGAIGHDLKTPLSALRVRVESVEDEAEREKMAGSIDELVRILDDILTLARLGKSGEAMQKSDMSAMIESIVDEFEASGGAASFVAPDSRCIAAVRPLLIRRALRNLIGNALKYGNTATLSVQQGQDNLQIYIDDKGPGIAADQIEAMFAPFGRADGSRNRATGGTGLGLTIARAIARSHGGEVTLANRTEGGLRATLTLPFNMTGGGHVT
jgi:signal transduction histidine kinase